MRRGGKQNRRKRELDVCSPNTSKLTYWQLWLQVQQTRSSQSSVSLHYHQSIAPKTSLHSYDSPSLDSQHQTSCVQISRRPNVSSRSSRSPPLMAAPSPSPSRRPPAFIRWLKSLTSSSHSKSEPSTKSASRGKGKSVRPVYQPPSRGLPVGAETEGRVFGVALEDSLKYASVAISMIGP